jgi:fluoride exporter
MIVLIMIGGFIGSTIRYISGEWFLGAEGFPVGTFLVNMVGCLLLGWFITYGTSRFKKKSSWMPFIATGVIGSFTTFSTFSLETFYLILDKEYILAILYVFSSVILGFFMTFIGIKMARRNVKKEGQPI